jgi:hypothetical protein
VRVIGEVQIPNAADADANSLFKEYFFVFFHGGK